MEKIMECVTGANTCQTNILILMKISLIETQCNFFHTEGDQLQSTDKNIQTDALE